MSRTIVLYNQNKYANYAVYTCIFIYIIHHILFIIYYVLYMYVYIYYMYTYVCMHIYNIYIYIYNIYMITEWILCSRK